MGSNRTHRCLNRSAGDLESEHRPGDTSASFLSVGGCTGDVVGNDDGLNGASTVHVARHAEDHGAAAIVADDIHDPGAVVRRDHRICYVLKRGTGEDVAHSAGVEKAAAHVSRKERQVAETATGDDTDLAFRLGRCARYDAPVPADEGEVRGMGSDHSGERFGDLIVRIVDELFHAFRSDQYPGGGTNKPPRCRSRARPIRRARASSNLRTTIWRPIGKPVDARPMGIARLARSR